MNNLKEYIQMNNDNNSLNNRGEIITSIGDNDTYDWEESYESHYTPYEDLFSDTEYDFE